MTWSEYMAARLLLAEERVGTAVRAAQRAEDAIVARSVEEVRRGTR